MGHEMGVAGLVADDIDNDGTVEVLCSAAAFGGIRTDYWYILEYQPSTATYLMTSVSDPAHARITALSSFHLDGSGVQRIFLGFEDGEVGVYHGATRLQVGWISTAGNDIRRILYADADNDGVREIVFCTDTTTYLCNASTFAVERQIPYGGSDLAAGNVDADPAIELVYPAGKVLQLSTTAVTEEWVYPGGAFGFRIDVGDVDSDGMQEIVGSTGSYVTCFDADVQSPKWQIPTPGGVSAILVKDVNGGAPEVVCGDSQWGSVHAHDGVTGAQLWSIPNPEHGVSRLAIADTDGDGQLEVMWGTGFGSGGQDIFFVYGIPSGTQEWKSGHIDGAFDALDVGDVDGDGRDEIVFVSYESESGYNDGVLFVLDAETKQVEWEGPHDLFLGRAWTGVHAVRIGDVDGDGSKEIVVGTDELYDGKIYVLNGSTRAIKASYRYDSGAPIWSLDIADVDNDGQVEIIAGGGREHTGAPGVYVYVINGATGAVEWKSVSLGAYWSAITAVRVADVNGNGTPDIVALNDFVYVIDGVTHVQWQSPAGGYTALDVARVNGDSNPDLVLGTAAGGVAALDGPTRSPIGGFTAAAGSVDAVRHADVNQDGSFEVAVAALGRVGLFSWAGANVAAPTPILGGHLGRRGSMALIDLTGGPYLEIIAGTNYSVIQVGLVATGDSDQDGLPDAWEQQYFGTGNLGWGPTDDPDGDGYSNWVEFQAGSNPNSSGSVPPSTGGGSGGGGGGSGGGCGGLGMEALIPLGLTFLGGRRRLRLSRKRPTP